MTRLFEYGSSGEGEKTEKWWVEELQFSENIAPPNKSTCTCFTGIMSEQDKAVQRSCLKLMTWLLQDIMESEEHSKIPIAVAKQDI